MIGTCFYTGQGLGNQMWAYSVVRSIAEKQNVDFGFLGIERFKGNALFPNLNFGIPISGKAPATPREWLPKGFDKYYREELVRNVDGIDVSPLDPRVFSASDGNFLDGGFQSEKYFSEPSKVKSWFFLGEKVRNVCTINLRGGEFKGVKSLFLPKQYFLNAIEIVKKSDPSVQFEVVTDDPKLARSWFPDYPIYSSGGVKRFHGGLYIHPNRSKIRDDFAKLQASKYLILSNSSFSWWGAYTNPNAELVIAPKYWANFNGEDSQWSTGDSLTKGWVWLDKAGRKFDYSGCLDEIQRRESKERDA
jgi:hypothetical protein